MLRILNYNLVKIEIHRHSILLANIKRVLGMYVQKFKGCYCVIKKKNYFHFNSFKR